MIVFVNTLRSYYLQHDDPNTLSEWFTTLQLDRYNIIKEERDAYKLTQENFQETIHTKNRMVQMSSLERYKTELVLIEMQNKYEESLNVKKHILMTFGVSTVN